MPRVDTAELYAAVRTTIAADTDIVEAVAPDGLATILEAEPDADDIPLPFMVWSIDEDDDRIEAIAHKIRIRISVFAATVDKARMIAGILLDKYQIPKRLPGGIASDNYRLTVLTKIHSASIPGVVRLKPDGVAMRMHSLEFDGRVRRET